MLLIPVLTLATVAYCLPQSTSTYNSAEIANLFSNWQPAGPGDERSPCPALNSLANHGIIPRNGLGLNITVLIEACKAINVGVDFATGAAINALNFTPNNPNTTFSLAMLGKHNSIEHDGSISRQDTALGNNSIYNDALFQDYLAHVGPGDFNVTNAEVGRQHVVARSMANDPDFSFPPQAITFSYAETALILSILSDPSVLKVPREYVIDFFENERLPYELGWRPSYNTTNIPTLFDAVSRLQYSSGPKNQYPEMKNLTQESLAAIIAGDMTSGELPCYANGTSCT